MARKPRGGENGDQEEQAGPPVKLPTVNKLKGLMKLYRDCKSDMGDITTELSGATKEMAEHGNLHVKAFNICKGLDRLSPEALAECLDHLIPYLDLTGLTDRAKSAQRLPLEGESDDTKDQGKAPPGSGKSGESSQQTH